MSAVILLALLGTTCLLPATVQANRKVSNNNICSGSRYTCIVYITAHNVNAFERLASYVQIMLLLFTILDN